MSATRHIVHTNLGLDVTAVEVEHEHQVRTLPHVDPHAREEMLEGWRPDHGTNFGLVLPVEEADERAAADPVMVTTLPSARVLAVEETCEMASVGAAMQSAFGRLFAAVERAGVDVIGPPFARYPHLPAEQVRFVLCAPIVTGAQFDATTLGDDVQDVVVPERRVASMSYRGAYEAMGPSWQQLMTWVADHDHRIAGPLEEAYLDDPDTCGPDGPETQLIVPIT